MTTQTPNAPALPVVERLRGRARFCADRGEVKTPGLCTEAADTIEHLLTACAFYEDAIDMMFDGPDESDESYARARWNDARTSLRAAPARTGEAK